MNYSVNYSSNLVHDFYLPVSAFSLWWTVVPPSLIDETGGGMSGVTDNMYETVFQASSYFFVIQNITICKQRMLIFMQGLEIRY
jgi:hypothetical protein